MIEKSYILNRLRNFTPDVIKEVANAACSMQLDPDEWFCANGYVRVDEVITAPDGAEYTKDGRYVFSGTKKWALSPEKAELAVKSSLTKKSYGPKATNTETVVSEELSFSRCPSCGEQMQIEGLCPACPAGSIGYRYKYICICGVEFISKRKI